MQERNPSGAGLGGSPGANNPDQFKAHETILHTLDRWIVTPDGEKVFVPADVFAKNVDAWNGVPLVYGIDHPDPKLFATDPKAALAAVKARLAGDLKAPTVAMEGSPRFMGQLDWGADPELDKLWADNKLSASIAYFSGGRDGGGQVKGPIGPNHVLLFELSAKDLPRDPGVFILNKATEVESMTVTAGEQDDPIGLLDRLKAALMRRAPAGASSGGSAGKGEEQDMSEEDKQKLASASKELEDFKTKLASKDAEIAELNKAKDLKIAELDKQLEAFHKTQAEEKWLAAKAKCPPGLVHAEKEAEMRKLFENDKDAFYEQLLNFKAANPTGKQGREFVGNKAGKTDEKTEAQVDAELMKYTTGVDVMKEQ